jgi:hypothetical protein
MVGHVFLSHSTHDDPLVAKLRRALEQLGYSCWTDSEKLTAGDRLEPEIRKARNFVPSGRQGCRTPGCEK